MNIFDEHEYEPFAINKYPMRGKCPKSPFANGRHRCGTIPVESVLDGGAPGDTAVVMCLHCEKVFKDRWFVGINQPRSLQDCWKRREAA